MRLTLRTLLAYMDDILEPADHEDLGKKIEASDFATELIHRSRDTVRRLRLGAPAVLSEGSDDVLDSVDLGDANAVAEYLDNTLPPEQVADFERMCLEPGNGPDMHLAEVASCHHVLTMVLGEPAEVESDLKSRMYDLPAKIANGQRLRIEPPHAAVSSVPETAPPTFTASPTAQSKVSPSIAADPELPDYLREAAAAKRRSRNWAIAVSFLVLCAVGAWLANPAEVELPTEVAENSLQDFDDGELDIEGLDLGASGDGQVTVAGDAASLATAPEFELGTTADTPAFDPSADTSSEPAPPFTAEVPTNEVTTTERVVPIVVSPADAMDDTSVPLAGDESDMAADAVEAATTIDGSVSVSSDGPTEQTVDGELMIVDKPSAPGRDENVPLVASTPEIPMPSEVPIESIEVETIDEDIEPAAPIGPQRLGNYLGNDDVLLFYSGDQREWIRMPPRSAISTGDTLLTLPKFFTHVVLADVNTYLSGGTRVHLPIRRFENATPDALLNMEIVYGRAMFNAGLDGSDIAVLVDDQLREFNLDGSASLAVDVQRMFVPGNDYENQAAPTIATWYLTSGSVEWPTATGGTQTIRGQMVWSTIDGIDEIPVPLEELPEWIGREPMTDMERSARDDLSKELEADGAVEIRLMELTDGKGLGRRREVRVLAAAASVFVGEFEPLVKALNDSDQSRAWDTHIHDLRQAMALSPDVAASVRQDFVDIRGEEAALDLFEMVEGYNAAQIGATREARKTGALAQLLKWLDHDSLDYRVLAIDNIRSITGKTKGYRPDDTIKDRKKNLRKLWAEFESNELLSNP